MGNECEKTKKTLFSPSFLVHFNPVEPLGLVCAAFPYICPNNISLDGSGKPI